MKILKILLASMGVLAVTFASLYYTDTYNYYELGENDHFDLKVGQTVSVKFDENPSTGHQHCWINQNTAFAVEKVSQRYDRGLRSKLGYMGAGGKLTMVFKAVKKGKEMIIIGNCPTSIEQKTCKDFNTANAAASNVFYLNIE
ncbi:protease inhibitor I42 family protein [Flavobacterium sp.]|uniref:protease inhibitor I42 family protein n=1 Tax=Flavobacterium sp. TaxID=239 RepID=UPI0039E48CBF